MPPLAHSLQTLLRLREHGEAQAERVLTSAQAELSREISALQIVERQISSVAAEHAASTRTVAPAAAFQARAAHHATLKGERSRLLHQVHVREQTRDEARRLFLLARQTRETLSELLRQKRLAREQEQTRLEQKRLDDLFTTRFRRDR